jgi:ketosteroid isomerase-like protein
VTAGSLEERNKALVAEYMELISSGDVEAAMALFDDDASWWVAGSLPGISGTYPIREYGEMAGGFAKECEGNRIPLVPKENGFTAEGDKVAVEARTHVGVSNGRTYDNEYHFVFEIRDGKILEVREYLDSDHARSVFLD